MDSVLDGYNATVFAYGATGCGKTHTITGTAQQPGIIFLTMQELEIYNETIRDLLVPGESKQGLMLREDANQAVSVAGLSSHHPKDVQEVMDMIVKGNEYRTISPTEANATSSRSHAHTMATLSIIDLAGSERASATKNRGERLIEGANINKSLLALGSCINALCDVRKKNHVPYRNSKLTRLLKFSLGGNCKTVMIVCVSPSSAHFDETQNTLRYANRAKNIQTKVTRNVYNVNRHVKDFLVKIDEQMAMINELKAQQKDYEAVAFVKFRKQNEKRDGITREGLNMKKLRQIERRIAILSAWVAAFDGVCESREDGVMYPSLTAMRKTAQGILLELENSRQHFHQKLEKMNWERAIDSALQNSIKQLFELEDAADGQDVANLTREVDLLKTNAGRDALLEVMEQEKSGDGGVMQVLLSAQFDLISSLNDLLNMDEEEAIRHAKTILGRLLKTSTAATANVVKPDGSLNITEAFPPTKRGTPKRKKHSISLDLQSRHAPPTPNLAPVAAAEAQAFSSPVRSSPKRRKAAVGKKSISFTPKKKSPSKRSVRWRDDTESGALAEFEKTPQKAKKMPEDSPAEQNVSLPALPSYLAADISSASIGSSPLPIAPEPSIDIKPKATRFQAGFLSRKSGVSPPPPTITSLSSSDSDPSPLRTIDPGKLSNRSSLHVMQILGSDSTPTDSGNNSSSEGENWPVDRSESAKIGLALKRAGSVSRQSLHGYSMSDSMSRTQRRRSPTAATVTSSPPNENMLFTASHARRMVNSQKDSTFSSSVLSPRAAPVMKSSARRTTIGDGRPVGNLSSQAVRLSGSVMNGTPRSRDSVAGIAGKGSWR